MTPEAAEAYHRTQIDSFVAAGADRVTIFTATHVGEAIGVVRAAAAAGIPVIVSFTVETVGAFRAECLWQMRSRRSTPLPAQGLCISELTAPTSTISRQRCTLIHRRSTGSR